VYVYINMLLAQQCADTQVWRACKSAQRSMARPGRLQGSKIDSPCCCLSWGYLHMAATCTTLSQCDGSGLALPDVYLRTITLPFGHFCLALCLHTYTRLA
jgi:hypothetical protein